MISMILSVRRLQPTARPPPSQQPPPRLLLTTDEPYHHYMLVCAIITSDKRIGEQNACAQDHLFGTTIGAHNNANLCASARKHQGGHGT